jgi:hypothetical protein
MSVLSWYPCRYCDGIATQVTPHYSSPCPVTSPHSLLISFNFLPIHHTFTLHFPAPLSHSHRCRLASSRAGATNTRRALAPTHLTNYPPPTTDSATTRSGSRTHFGPTAPFASAQFSGAGILARLLLEERNAHDALLIEDGPKSSGRSPHAAPQ